MFLVGFSPFTVTLWCVQFDDLVVVSVNHVLPVNEITRENFDDFPWINCSIIQQYNCVSLNSNFQ